MLCRYPIFAVQTGLRYCLLRNARQTSKLFSALVNQHVPYQDLASKQVTFMKSFRTFAALRCLG